MIRDGFESVAQALTEGRYDPLHQAHAIEQVVIQLGFTREMSDAEFTLPIWQKIHARVARDVLPAFQPETGIRVDTTSYPPRARPGAMAFNFASLLPDGSPGIVLRVERGLIAFASTQYSRWPSFTSQAFAAIRPVFQDDIWPLGIRLSSAGIGYNNRFIWHGALDAPRAWHLIRPHSKWVVPRIYEAEQNWHSYTGAFERSSPQTSRLVVVNIDAVTGMSDVVETKSVGLVLNLTENILLKDNNVTPLDHNTAVKSLDWAQATTDRLHTVEKSVVGEIITDEMQHRINLHAPVTA